jgi:hypothetical protein
MGDRITRAAILNAMLALNDPPPPQVIVVHPAVYREMQIHAATDILIHEIEEELS